MKGILKRLTLATLILAMALTLIALPSMAEEEPYSIYSFINERHDALGDFDKWPLEEKAAFSEWCIEQGIEQYCVYGMPGKDNMTVEEALDLARQGIIDKYAIKETVLREKFWVEMEFMTKFINPANFVKFAVKEAEPLEQSTVGLEYVAELESDYDKIFGTVDNEHPFWRFTFRVKDYDDIMDLGYYMVNIYDQTKEMEIYSVEDSHG